MKHPFLIELESSLGRAMTPEESLSALAGLYLQHRDLLRDACSEAVEWLKHHGGDALPPNEPGLRLLIDTLESAIEQTQ